MLKILRGLTALALLACAPALAQLTDITQTPNAVNAGIKKSLEDQVAAGIGDALTPDSSIYLIQRDPFRAISRGQKLFQRKFTIDQGLGPRTGNGHGDIETTPIIGAGLSDSCAGCHSRPHGSAGVGGNVFTRPDSRDAPHLFGLGLVEMIADEMTTQLRDIQSQALATAANNGTPKTVHLKSKGVSFGRITAHPNGVVDTDDIEGLDEDLRVKPFFAEGSSFSIREFSVGAFNAEMGMQSGDPVLLAASQGQTVTTAAGMVLDGALDILPAPPVETILTDGDGDGKVNEIDPALIDHTLGYLGHTHEPIKI